ncbi:hypothetical protein PYW08_003349 [Mythimna loreyi]|uniref:Uncharacterized protein n=1 Tax=Mythimna loreyi TaxID=667449 RepID=A0ACC2QTH5_9NEOP|nr:hypothetical protein PYW08_003349 [Mythimna loreyi]
MHNLSRHLNQFMKHSDQIQYAMLCLVPNLGNRTGPPSGTRSLHTHCLHPAIQRDLPPVPVLNTHIASIRQSNGTSLRYPSSTHTLPPFSTFSDYLHCHAGVGHRAQVNTRARSHKQHWNVHNLSHLHTTFESLFII